MNESGKDRPSQEDVEGRAVGKLSPGQKSRIIALVEGLEPATTGAEMWAIEQFAVHAINASEPEYEANCELIEEQIGRDEFFLDTDEVAAMSPKHRLAYVGHLTRCLVLAYGLDDGVTMHERPGTIAELLRGVHDIIEMPLPTDG